MCNIWGVWFNETVKVCVLRSVAKRRQNSSAVATVNQKERDHCEDRKLDWWTILSWILER
jgi:hypothetical protein